MLSLQNWRTRQNWLIFSLSAVLLSLAVVIGLFARPHLPHAPVQVFDTAQQCLYRLNAQGGVEVLNLRGGVSVVAQLPPQICRPYALALVDNTLVLQCATQALRFDTRSWQASPAPRLASGPRERAH